MRGKIWMLPVDGWKPEPEVLTEVELLAHSSARPADTFDTIGKARLVLSACVFEKFLGWEWCNEHFLGAKGGFLYSDFSGIMSLSQPGHSTAGTSCLRRQDAASEGL
jgi:hypothetical protein